MNNTGPACPLCESAFEGRRDLRVHLMVSHRKSAVTDELLRLTEHDDLTA